MAADGASGRAVREKGRDDAAAGVRGGQDVQHAGQRRAPRGAGRESTVGGGDDRGTGFGVDTVQQDGLVFAAELADGLRRVTDGQR